MNPMIRAGGRAIRGGLSVAWGLGLGALAVDAHTLSGDPAHPHYDWSVKPPEAVAVDVVRRTAHAQPRRENTGGESAAKAANSAPQQAAAFRAFAPRVAVRWDEAFLYVESNGLPTHGMMVGITAWQQQVPLPQAYVGRNAWRIPLQPVAATEPVSIKGRFLRGAIALAANGIPIFNPQNNRGEVSAEIGELDQWGGHCGRADDYHYHAAPLHLQVAVGEGRPIAYALDTTGGAATVKRPIERIVWHAPIDNARPHSAIRPGDFKLLYYWNTRTTELFNLAQDPGETRNLAAASAAQADAMRAQLQSHLRSGLGDAAYAALVALGQP